VGYNESGFCFLTPAPCNTDADCPGNVCETVATKSGSHNLVVGPDNTYTNWKDPSSPWPSPPPPSLVFGPIDRGEDVRWPLQFHAAAATRFPPRPGTLPSAATERLSRTYDPQRSSSLPGFESPPPLV